MQGRTEDGLRDLDGGNETVGAEVRGSEYEVVGGRLIVEGVDVGCEADAGKVVSVGPARVWRRGL